MKYKLVLLSLILIGIILVSGCAEQVLIEPEEERIDIENEEVVIDIPEKKLYYCEKNEDCIKITRMCCGCNNGGSEISINKEYYENITSHWSEVCMETDCIEEESLHISCFSESTCIYNTCKLIPKKQMVCDSLLFFNCKEHILQNQWDVTQKDFGTSCREVIKLCE